MCRHFCLGCVEDRELVAKKEGTHTCVQSKEVDVLTGFNVFLVMLNEGLTKRLPLIVNTLMFFPLCDQVFDLHVFNEVNLKKLKFRIILRFVKSK